MLPSDVSCVSPAADAVVDASFPTLSFDRTPSTIPSIVQSCDESELPSYSGVVIRAPAVYYPPTVRASVSSCWVPNPDGGVVPFSGNCAFGFGNVPPTCVSDCTACP
jgi:hypothetical protein